MEKVSRLNEISSSIHLCQPSQCCSGWNGIHNATEVGKSHVFNVSLEDFMCLPPSLGLKLSPSAVQEIQDSWNVEQRAKESASISKKFNAACFSATLLKIGKFMFVPTREGDLVVKFYFAKRKILWEIFDKSKLIKHKVEVPWQNIKSMRATIKDNSPGVLEIELNEVPEFYKEIINPRPRSHTMWDSSKDFTEGHALTYRRHYLEFLPGVLDKYYEQLLQSDSRLWKLSKESFPSLESPYFGSPLLDEETTDNSHVQDLPSSSFLALSTSPTFVVADISSNDINRFKNPIPHEQDPCPSEVEQLSCGRPDDGNFDDIMEIWRYILP